MTRWTFVVALMTTVGCSGDGNNDKPSAVTPAEDAGPGSPPEQPSTPVTPVTPPAAPNCTDKMQNAAETDVDCGGQLCAKCENGKRCSAPSDCVVNACTAGVCEMAACQNAAKDGTESDVDCGGATCGACDTGKACNAPGDCKSSLCVAGVCAAKACADGVKNGNETAVDCGGDCEPCPSAVDGTVPYDFAKSVAFLYTGPGAHQQGLDPSKLDPARITVVRGRVLDRALAPVADVRVSIHGKPAFGHALTRADGTYDLVTSSSGNVTVDFEKKGVLPLQRRAQARPRSWTLLDDVVVTPLDTAVTEIDFSAPVQVHRATTQQDGDGPRRATLMFSQGTTAGMEVSGATQPLSKINVRATELTTGATGKAAMPGELPSSSAYTYAVELSVDEAIAAGASTVLFSKPVAFYLDNFLGFKPGGRVPVGYYDRNAGAWVPVDDGLVIKILSITGGLADLDVDGSGAAADATKLASLGISDAERTQLATLYAGGASLWRATFTHFTTYDCNWPYTPPDDAIVPKIDIHDKKDRENPDCTGGSIIECDNGVLGERLPIAGSPLTLNYRSSRVPGDKTTRSISVTITPETIPSSLTEVEVKFQVGGRRKTQVFAPSPNKTVTLEWNGEDPQGRAVNGAMPYVLQVGYRYAAQYRAPSLDPDSDFQRSFNRPSFQGLLDGINSPNGFQREMDRGTLVLWRTVEGQFGLQGDAPAVGGWQAKGAGFGGFTLDVHHAYDPASRIVWQGDGTLRREAVTQRTGPYMVDTGIEAKDLAFGSDGSMYGISGNTIFRRRPGGATLDTIAGADNPTNLSDGNGGNALAAHLNRPRHIAIGPDDSVYFTEIFSYVRRVRPDGVIEVVAGGGTSGATEGALATDIELGQTGAIAVARDGTIYFTEASYFGGGHYVNLGSRQGVRSITTDGRIHYLFNPVAQEAQPGFGFTMALDDWVHKGIALDPEGNLYVADGGLSRIRPSGQEDRVLRRASPKSTPQGVQLNANDVRSVAVTPRGTLLLLGQVVTSELADDGTRTVFWDRNEAAPWRLPLPNDTSLLELRFAPDGQIYAINNGLMSPEWADRVYVLTPSKIFDGGGTMLPSQDGEELFVFDAQGRHTKTLSKTNVTIWAFAYDASGLLNKITDRDGRITTIERDAAGLPTAIVAPGGQRTTLAVDANGWLSKATYPDGASFTMTYSTDGLLKSMVDRRAGTYTFEYNAEGKLVSDTDPTGAKKTLVATGTSAAREINVAAPSGAKTTYTSARDGTSTRTEPTGLLWKETSGNQSTVVAPDGSTLATSYGPDPRFGMFAPLRTQFVFTTPSGKQIWTNESRTVTLQSPGELTSLTSQVDTAEFNGAARTTTYDVAARTVTTASPAGRTAVVTYDDKERPVAVNPDSAAIAAPVQFVYDTLGRVTKIGQASAPTTLGYDSADRPTSMTDGLGRVSELGYDAADRVTQVKRPSGRTYGLTRDAAGNLVAVVMPSGATHALSYDARDLQIGYAPPSGGSAAKTFTIDGDKNLTSLADGGRTITYGYDAGARLVGASYADGTMSRTFSASKGQLLTTTLTPAGASTQLAQSLAFTYDGSLVTSHASTGDAQGTVTFTYNTNLTVSSMKLDSGAARTIAYDADGLVTTDGPFTIVRGGPVGTATSITDAAVAVHARTYDGAGRDAGWSLTAGGSAKYVASVTYDAAGQPAVKLETVDGKQRKYEYGYDVDGQLVSVKRTDLDADTSSCEVYAYDVNGNRTTGKKGTCGSEETTEAATYDQDDRVKTRGAINYAFDASGYLTQRGGDTFKYAARGELLAVTLDAGQPGEKTIAYSYDPLGRRVARREGSAKTQYFYAGAGTAITHTKTGAVVSEYFYDDAQRLYGVVRDGTRYYVATDAVGTPRLVTTTGGAVVMEVEYDAFGRVVSGDPTTFELPVGFGGGIPDFATRLVRMGARDYDPELGRFTARDPVLFAGGQYNLYVYAENEPIVHNDPSGLASGFCAAATQLANREKKLGGPKAYAWDVLPWFSDGRLLGPVGDGNVTVGRDGKETVNGVDFNYAETAYAAVKQAGPVIGGVLGVYGQFTYSAIAAPLHVARGMSMKNAAKNFAENMRGALLGTWVGARYPNLEAYRRAECECSK